MDDWNVCIIKFLQFQHLDQEYSYINRITKIVVNFHRKSPKTAPSEPILETILDIKKGSQNLAIP